MKKISILLIAITLMVGCKKEEQKSEKIVRPVVYKTVGETSSSLSRTFSGTIKSETESNVSFRVSGTVQKKYVKLGSKVKRGQVLAKLDPTDYEVKYQESVAKLEDAKANLVKYEADYERYQKLYYNDNASKAEYDNALARFKSGKAQVKAATKQVRFDKLQLGYTRLRAAATGTIAAEYREENETLAAGTPIFLLSVDGDLEVEFFIPESLISSVKVGEKVKLNIDAIGEEAEGTIKKVGTVSTGFGKTYPVKAVIKSDSDKLKSGMTAKVMLDFNFSDSDVILLPLESVITDVKGAKYVFVAKPSKGNHALVSKKYVETGKVTSRGIEITSGLTVGDKIITAGMSKVKVGMEVKVLKQEVK